MNTMIVTDMIHNGNSVEPIKGNLNFINKILCILVACAMGLYSVENTMAACWSASSIEAAQAAVLATALTASIAWGLVAAAVIVAANVESPITAAFAASQIPSLTTAAVSATVLAAGAVATLASMQGNPCCPSQ